MSHCENVVILIMVLFPASQINGDAHFQPTTPRAAFYFQPTTIKYERFPKSSDSNIRNEIKSVLKLQTGNETLDNLILNLFNTENPDPLYVFVIPDKHKNKTLILHKSNFAEAIYPNVSTIPKKLQENTFFGDHRDNIGSASQKRVQRQQQIQNPAKFDNFKFNGPSDLEDEKTLYVVEENVRTEKNFFKFMDDLNRNRDNTGNGFSISRTDASVDVLTDEEMERRKEADYYEYITPNPQHSSPYQFEPIFSVPIAVQSLQAGYPRFYEQITSKRPRVNWNDLGLNGWVGGLSQHGKEFIYTKDPETTESYSERAPHSLRQYKQPSGPTHVYVASVQTFSNHPSPMVDQKNHQPITNYNSQHSQSGPAESFESKPIDSTSFEYPETTTSKEVTWEVDFKIPDELASLLLNENSKLRDSLITKRPVWPITSSRAAHRDEDVFIGRANNPFGHSTKWKKSNTSTDDENFIGEESRWKRGALELYSMIKCSTGCDPLVYKGYGCYCGFLGAGRTLDGIDRCCKMHDNCYETANCPMFLEYFVPYLWKCYRGRPLCAIDHGEWGGPGSCASRLCECDQALSKCLRRFYCPRKRAVCTTSPLRLLQNVIMDI